MRKSFVDINQINSVEFPSAVNLTHWELAALLLQNVPYQEALLSDVHPPLPFTKPFLWDCIWVQLLVQCYVPGWKRHVWMDTKGWLVMNVYMPRTGSDFGVEVGDEGEVLGKRE